MKKLILLVLMIGALTSNAQIAGNLRNSKTSPDLWFQCLNPANNTGGAYFGTILPSGANLGDQYDTITNTTVLTLQLCNLVVPGKVNVDTLIPAHLDGYGQISGFVRVGYITGTNDSVICTLVEALDGTNNWSAVPYVAPVVLKPTTIGSPFSGSFDFTTFGTQIWKTARHYGVQFKGIATSTNQVRAWIRLYNMK